MLPSLLKYELLNSACFAAVETAFAANQADGGERLSNSHLGFIARIRIWLRMIWGQEGAAQAELISYTAAPAPNRAAVRLARRPLSLSRQGGEFSIFLWRAFGRARYLRYLYDETLTPRVRWCFTKWNWKWAGRLCFVSCGYIPHVDIGCHAPLFPD